MTSLLLFKKGKIWPWLVWLSGLSTSLRTKGLPVRFPVRAHAWAVGQVPSGGHMRGNHMLMLFFSLPSPLCKNKINKIFKRKKGVVTYFTAEKAVR